MATLEHLYNSNQYHSSNVSHCKMFKNGEPPLAICGMMGSVYDTPSLAVKTPNSFKVAVAVAVAVVVVAVVVIMVVAVLVAVTMAVAVAVKWQ